jgi:hypothetical protein
MFRPQRTTVLLAIAAEPAEKPDARVPALDRNSALTPVSQSLSLVNRTSIIARSNDLKIFSEVRNFKPKMFSERFHFNT